MPLWRLLQERPRLFHRESSARRPFGQRCAEPQAAASCGLRYRPGEELRGRESGQLFPGVPRPAHVWMEGRGKREGSEGRPHASQRRPLALPLLRARPRSPPPSAVRATGLDGCRDWNPAPARPARPLRRDAPGVGSACRGESLRRAAPPRPPPPGARPPSLPSPRSRRGPGRGLRSAAGAAFSCFAFSHAAEDEEPPGAVSAGSGRAEPGGEERRAFGAAPRHGRPAFHPPLSPRGSEHRAHVPPPARSPRRARARAARPRLSGPAAPPAERPPRVGPMLGGRRRAKRGGSRGRRLPAWARGRLRGRAGPAHAALSGRLRPPPASAPAVL